MAAFIASTAQAATAKLGPMRRSPRCHALPLCVLIAACGGSGSGETGEVPATTTTEATGDTPTTDATPTATTATTTDGTTGTADTGVDAAVTYYRDIKPILDASCTQCHTPGNIAPFSLLTYDEARPFAIVLADSVDDGTMPPWPPDNACRSYPHDRSLPEAQRQLLRAWAELGAPAGDPKDAPPPPDAPADPIDYDIELELAPYSPTIGPDEYRCFLIDWPKTEESFVTALDVIPGDRQLVHHVIAYALEPKDVDAYRALEASDPDPGYLCYGGPGGAGNSVWEIPWLGAWVPGSSGGAMPAGTGLRVQPGSVIAVQMHYHGTAGDKADQSRLRLRTTPKVERQAVIMPFTNLDWVLGSEKMDIPAGEPDAVQSFELDMTGVVGFIFPNGPLTKDAPFVVHAAGLHQHTLGTTSTLEVVRGGGAGNECLLDIPRWDFDWQGTYEFSEPVTVNPGDRIRVECHWDNSAANQPIVDGVQQPPHRRRLGRGHRRRDVPRVDVRHGPVIGDPT